MLKNKLGVLQYLFLSSDRAWRKLSPEEKEIIRRADISFNSERDDYKNPDKYGASRIKGGESWDAQEDRLSFYRGLLIDETLERKRPKSVLEVGPGSGFFSRLICEKDYVKEYTGIDIVEPFLNYLEEGLKSLKKQKKDFNFELIWGDFMNLSYEGCFDLIVLISTVHHIPNREDLFLKLAKFLRKGGSILCIDPSHYWLRKAHLFKNIPVYLKKSYYLEPRNLGTHHMCSLEEYKRVSSKSGLGIEKEWYILPKKIMKNKIISHPTFWRRLSGEMAILLKKN